MRRILFAILMVILTAPIARAQPLDDVVSVTLRPGWRLADGDHMAAVSVRLAPGWKTYWRSPGDGGIPPIFDWDGTRATNVLGVGVHFPTPKVFWQAGMRSVGYSDQVVFPLRIRLRDNAGDALLRGEIELGVCLEVCIPYRTRVRIPLPASMRAPDPVIAAALASAPLTAAEAGLGGMRCAVAPMEGGMRLRVTIPGIDAGQAEAVIETADPEIWVADPKTRREGDALILETRLRHRSGGAFALDRSGVRVTVLRARDAVDLQGCRR